MSPARKREMLEELARRRAARMQPNGRPCFDLTEEECRSSAETAMRLAGAIR